MVRGVDFSSNLASALSEMGTSWWKTKIYKPEHPVRRFTILLKLPSKTTTQVPSKNTTQVLAK